MTPHPATTPARLLERDSELSAVAHVLGQVRDGTGGLVVIDGPAGVGKTALLEAVRAEADAAGLLTLRARGTELERAFAYGVSRQLFDDLLLAGTVDVPALFTGAARFAAPLLAVEIGDAPPVPSEDPFAARHALYWLTANLAAEQPLAVLVDDAHWADAASLGALAHVGHRLEGIPVALVVACRAEESHPALDAVRREAATHGTLLHLGPLGADAAAAVVRSYVRDADEALCRACHTATGGNAFLLHELVRSQLEGPLDPERVPEQSPQTVTREIAARLARLPAGARRIAQATALLGEDVPLRQAAALAEVDPAEAAEAADVLVAAGVLGSVHPLEFLHPLVRAAVYADLGPSARTRDHARAARLLAAEGAAPDRVAAQLLRCQPAGDAWAYDQLVGAARLASARGAVETAATYLSRALDEPAPQDQRADLLLELATAEAKGSDPVPAIEHLREALAVEIPLEQRFPATMLLAGLLGHTGHVPEAVDVLEEEIEALAGRPDLRGTAEAALANISRIDPTTRPRAARAIERMRARVGSGEERDPAVLGSVSAEMGMAGEPVDLTADVAERALVGEATAAAAEGWSRFNAIRSLVASERYELALRTLEQMLEASRERGAVIDAGGVFTFRAELYLHVGDLAAAEVDARALHGIATEFGWPLGEGFAAAVLGDVLIERGELDEAERLLTEGTFAGPAAALPQVYPLVWVLEARGRLRLAQERFEDAAEELRESGRRAVAIGHVNPAIGPWRSLLAGALAALGQDGEARALAAEELERARACGSLRAIGIALGGMARLQDGDLALLREAVAVLDGSQARLERARAHGELGAALRRAGASEEAREPLRRAIDLAHRCGAVALEDRALAELRATGARPRRRATTGIGALTPSERRIAELAATGQQNREIAEALFVTTATVEFHLRHAYRKLGIASRTQLVDALRGS
jgi:DNA-binding CsgD family transcriptional regulator